MASRKTIFITGASRGLGAELTRHFLSNGFNVFATARDPSKIAGQVGSPGKLVCHKLDVTDYIQCQDAIQTCLKQFGTIDALVNNASAYTGGRSIGELPPHEIDTEINTTLRGPIYLSSLYVDAMRSHGRGDIFFISSTSGLPHGATRKYGSLYSAAKAALIRFSECLNLDISDFGMCSHVLVPGNIREDRFIEEAAVSYSDIARTIMFMMAHEDNICIQSMIIQPAKTARR